MQYNTKPRRPRKTETREIARITAAEDKAAPRTRLERTLKEIRESKG